jgi:hypothetical protein
MRIWSVVGLPWGCWILKKTQNGNQEVRGYGHKAVEMLQYHHDLVDVIDIPSRPSAELNISPTPHATIENAALPEFLR